MSSKSQQSLDKSQDLTPIGRTHEFHTIHVSQRILTESSLFAIHRGFSVMTNKNIFNIIQTCGGFILNEMFCEQIFIFKEKS